MNDRIHMTTSSNRFDNMMMMHEQGKLLPNESLYQIDGRFMLDDGGMEELMNGSGSEQLNDFPHMEQALKPNFMTNPGPTSLISSVNEDYYNQFTFGQIMMSNNHVNSVNSGMGLNPGTIGSLSGHHYSYHTLQPTQSGAHPGQHHLIGAVNSPYAQIGANSSAAVYSSKMALSRTPPYPIVNSNSATSPSASSSSNSSSSSNHSTHGNTQQGNSASNGGGNNAAASSSNSAECHDYEPGQVSASPSNNSVPNPADPAEIVRQKQMRGLKLTQDEIQLLVKDRQRKDNHNMIERKRRFNINDRIKELGDMLPKNGDYDAKQNKGSILKGSVDYMNQLKSECDEARKIQEAYKQVLTLNKKLVARIKEYEAFCKANGLTLPGQMSQSGMNIMGPNGLANNPNNLVNPYLSHQSISYHHDPGSLINPNSSNMPTLNMNGYANFNHNLNESPLMVVDHSSSNNNHLPFSNGSVGNFSNKNAYISDSYHPINSSSHGNMNNPNSSYVNENATFTNAAANGAIVQQLNGSVSANGANQMMRPGKSRKRPAVQGSSKSDSAVRDSEIAKDSSSDEIKDKAAETEKQPDEKKPKEEPISPTTVLKQAAATDKKDSTAETSCAKETAVPAKNTSEPSVISSDDHQSKSAQPTAQVDNQTSTSENLYVASDMRPTTTDDQGSPKISLVKLVTPNDQIESSKTDAAEKEAADSAVIKETDTSKANLSG